jgi:hypothetical protein
MEVLSFRIPSDDREILEKIAKSKNMRVSDCVRAVIHDFAHNYTPETVSPIVVQRWLKSCPLPTSQQAA